MRIHHGLAPLSLLWADLPADDTPWMTIHKCYARRFWRERGPWERLRVLPAFVLWPFLHAMVMAWLTLRNGPGVRRRSGKGISRQLLEQTLVLVRHSIAPPWYYAYELYDDQKRSVAERYLHRYETKSGVFNFLKKAHGGSSRPLSDKLEFFQRGSAAGLPVVPVLLALEGGEVAWSAGETTALPHVDLFIKPRRGRGGRGAERWLHRGSGVYEDVHGRRLVDADLLRHVKDLSREAPCIVQPCIANHPALLDITTGAVVTIRVVTVLDEVLVPEATHAVVRMPLAADSVVDNFHAGGIASAIDMRSGTLGRATAGGVLGLGMFPDTGWCDAHPHTGGRIAGREFPHFADAVALARRAHAAFPGLPAVGWDVAITPAGPVLIEGNSGPDVDILERTYGRPLGDTRFGELLAHHVRRALGEAEHAGAAAR